MAGAAPGARGAHRGGGGPAVGPRRGDRRPHRRRRGPRPGSTSTTRGASAGCGCPICPRACTTRWPPRGRAASTWWAATASARASGRPPTGPGCSSTGAGGPCRRLPQPRAAGGAAIVRNRIYVVGGTTARAAGNLAVDSLLLDLRTLRWQGFAGLSRPREHLGVTALGGRVYAIGGRTEGLETNTAAADAYDPRARRWSRLPDAPTRRGGNGATAVGGQVVALGGEGPDGTIRPVDAFDPAGGTWRSLPRSPRPRHGVAVVGLGRALYQGLGGPEPGLTVSPTLQSLRVPAPR